MGMFDTVHVRCPHCGFDNEVQSKAGSCVLAHYDTESVPVDIADALDERVVTCESCSARLVLAWPRSRPRRVAMEVRTDDDDEEDDRWA